MNRGGVNPLLQEPLPQLRDAGEPLLDVSTAAKRLELSGDSVRALAQTGKLLGFERNCASTIGAEKKSRWVFPARALKLYEAKTANFCGMDVAQLCLDIARRLSPALRLWLRTELTRLERGE